jgi:hypothetical protein
MHHLTHTEFRATHPDAAPRARRIAWLGFVPIALLALAAHVPVAHAQAGTAIGEQLHASAVASFRQARFSEAYGRFIGLADAGHAPAAAMALWMYLNGASLFGKEWDSTQEQLTAWAQLARQPAPVLVGRAYPQPPRAGAKPGR